MTAQRITRREALALLGTGAATLLGPRSVAGVRRQERAPVVRTVLADLPPSALRGGTTLFHEHLSHSPDWNARMAARPSQAGAPPFVARRDPITGCANDAWAGCDNLDFMVEELVRAKRDGVVCIVDGSQVDRNVAFLTETSRRSGVSIVASGGYYVDEMHPPEIRSMSEEQIARLLVEDATTHSLGAFGEIGTSEEITPNERKVFRAVGIAHRATDLPIFTHTANGVAAEEQLDVLESAGVAPARVAIGHLGSVATPDVTVHKALCARGAYVGFDRQGGRRDEMNVGMVLELIDAGYAANILVSADFGVNQWPSWQQNGGPGVSRALTVFVPRLREAGVPEETLIGILEDNPLRFLTCSPRVPRGA
jgi:phosphotriesterase-related protein